MTPLLAVRRSGPFGAAVVLGLALLVTLVGDRHAAAAVPGLAVASNGATARFPDGITFSLAASAETEVERVELLYAPAGHETLNLVTPDFVAGREVDVSHELDLRVRYLPPGVDIVYRWRLTDVAGDVIETAEQTIRWEDSRFTWTSMGTSQVTVFSYGGDEDFSRTILQSAQRTVDRVTSDLAVGLTTPIRIWVYSSKEDFAGALAPNSHPWIVGTAYPEYDLILAVLPTGNEAEVGRVIPHEVTHQVIHQATHNPFNEPPTWLDEGIAYRYQEGGTEPFLALISPAVDDGRLYSVRALNSLFPYEKADADLAYGESLSIVNFIVEEFGEEGLRDLIYVFEEGVSYDEAVQRALGISIDELDRRWKESLGYAGDRMAPGGSIASDDESPAGSLGGAEALASGAVVMAASALLAIAAGAVVVRRARRGGDGLEVGAQW